MELNFLEETLEVMKAAGVTEDDITFIGSRDGVYECTFEEFKTLADFTYDSGFGAQKVAMNLVINFKNGLIFDRGEYDGSEWWRWTSSCCIKQA